MPSNQRSRPARSQPRPVGRNEWKLLLCIAIFLASVLLKYADFDFARQVRAQAAGILRGGADVGEVIETVGRLAESDGLLAVFGAQAAGEQEPQETGAPASTPVSAPAVTGDPEYVEPGGFAEDLEDRKQTLFPDTADETAYVMQFTHTQPVEATLTSTFGQRTHPISGKRSYHYGLDLAAPEGTPIGALADGVVRETGNGSYGNYLIVDHADGFSTLYAHCSKLLAAQGDSVQVGQEIAQVGATGNATGNHLHLEVWRDGKALNPLHYVTY